jgi:WhiB family redox-sensing transcriptional regulator
VSGISARTLTRVRPQVGVAAVHGWQWRAECRMADPALFYPPEFERPSVKTRRVAEAMAVCARCDVRADCLTYAVVNREQGIWGGTTDEQRRIMRQVSA